MKGTHMRTTEITKLDHGSFVILVGIDWKCIGVVFFPLDLSGRNYQYIESKDGGQRRQMTDLLQVTFQSTTCAWKTRLTASPSSISAMVIYATWMIYFRVLELDWVGLSWVDFRRFVVSSGWPIHLFRFTTNVTERISFCQTELDINRCSRRRSHGLQSVSFFRSLVDSLQTALAVEMVVEKAFVLLGFLRLGHTPRPNTGKINKCE